MAAAVSIPATVSAVAATSLAAERALPLHPLLEPLFGQPGAQQAGLVRGQVIGCGGVAPLSLALALAGTAARAGAWLAVVDVASLGLEAAAELGVPLQRLVGVETGPAGNWPEVMAAVADGFEIVVAAVPPGVSATMARKVHQRLRARGTVLLALCGDRQVISMPSDVDVRALAPVWEGIGSGHGYLCSRRLVIEATGRRMPARRSVEVLLPGPSGGLEAAPGQVIPLEVAS